MRRLIELDPAAWLRFLRVPISDPDRVRVIDSNVSTVTAEADKVLWVDDPVPWIEHIELQAGRDGDLPERVHWYSTSLGYPRKVPVHTTIVLLRPAADGPELSGTFEKRDRRGDVYDWFRYDVVRIWEQRVEDVLAAGLPVLPLAPVSSVPPAKIPELLTAILQRLVGEASPGDAATPWAATRVLMGLRYSNDQVRDLTKGLSAMILGIRGIEESSVYQDIFAKGVAQGEVEGEARGEARGETRGEVKGRLSEAREAVLLVGRKRFGHPDEQVVSRLDAVQNVDQLNAMLERILDLSNWQELLALMDAAP
jgi:hypothetical protein